MKMPLTPIEKVQFKGMRRLNSNEVINADDQQAETNLNGDGNPQDNNHLAPNVPYAQNVFVEDDNEVQPKRRGSNISDIGSYSSSAHDYSNLTIYQVCRTGDVNALQALLKRKPILKSINVLDNYDLSALHYAAKYNHYQCARLLIARGASARVLGVDDTTPLHFTAIYRKSNKKPDATLEESESAEQTKLIKLFCGDPSRPRADVNAKDRYGCTALHMASYKGNKAALVDLLECGADIQCKDETDMTPLHMAASYGYFDICSILLEHGAAIYCLDQEQSTPLHLAASGDHVGISRILLEEAAKQEHNLVKQLLCATDTSSQTALHVAVDQNCLKTVEVLFEHGAEAHIRMEDNYNYPLHLAAQNGEMEMLELVFNQAKEQTHKQGSDILNVQNKGFETPLHKAASYNREKAIEFLLQNGANIDAVDEDGYTALLVAAYKGHEAVTEQLLNAKADASVVDSLGKNLLHMVAETESVPLAKKLLEKSDVKDLLSERDQVGNTPLHVAARNGTAEMLRVFYDKGGDITMKNEDEQTVLHLAADYGRTTAVKLICELDDDLVGVEDENSNTALHLAATEGYEKVVTVLIQYQADVESRNIQQWTPLDCAAAKGWTRCARILLENDAPVDATDKSSITPLYLACQNNHPQMVKLLLDYDGSLEIRCSSNGKNPLDIAIESQSKQCVEAILDNEEWWKYALQNRTAFNDKDTTLTNTPMRKLIRRMPEMAVKAFNNCIIPDKNHGPNDEEFCITFIYEFIDDDYSMTNWLPEPSAGTSLEGSLTGATGTSPTDNAAESDKGSLRDSVNAYGEKKVYVEEDRFTGRKPYVCAEAKKYSESTKTLIKNHPLSVMVNEEMWYNNQEQKIKVSSEAEHLLQHPLVLMLLRHKWSAFGSMVYYANLLQFLIYLSFLTGYIVVTKPKHFWKGNASSVYDNLDDYIRNQDGSGVNWNAFRVFNNYGQWVVIAFAVFNLIKEMFQIKVYKMVYFTSGTNAIEVGCFSLALVLTVPTALGFNDDNTPNAPQWQCGAVAIFLSWINLVLFIQKFPKFGIYVVMFTDILVTFFNFFLVFFLFIVAFGMGFYTLLQNQNDFSTVVYAMIKTGVMMIGEFEYTDIFFGDPDTNPKGSWQVVTLLFFVVFAVIMSIITMNLLVGLAVDDIKAVQDTAVLQRMAMQVELALQVQHILPERFRKYFIIKQETLYPNKINMAASFLEKTFGTGMLDGPTIMKSLTIDQEPMDALKSRQEKMIHQLKMMESLMKDMQKSQDMLQRSVHKMAEKQGIELNEDDYVGEVDDDED
ncbi:transient receptor potential cation channel subfamily A member 1 homolog isoform X2 [Convolutriloba macropyga]|uniref:transient receptor potential cation channel subfamily A member 1 homolog isoform X2 n=1 Tax=Convolutriloba macropyga TaxID=536237 RepID=UPI003F526A4D